MEQNKVEKMLENMEAELGKEGLENRVDELFAKFDTEAGQSARVIKIGVVNGDNFEDMRKQLHTCNITFEGQAAFFKNVADQVISGSELGKLRVIDVETCVEDTASYISNRPDIPNEHKVFALIRNAKDNDLFALTAYLSLLMTTLPAMQFDSTEDVKEFVLANMAVISTFMIKNNKNLIDVIQTLGVGVVQADVEDVVKEVLEEDLDEDARY